jgi:alkyl hydroperoxide reductase subunit AhpC
LAVILTALDRLREVYPDDVGRYAEAMLRIVEAVSLAEDE